MSIPVYRGAVPDSLSSSQRASVDVSGVPAILDAVRTRGDDAIAEFNQRFDGSELRPFELVGAELDDLLATVSDEIWQVLREAHARISSFAKSQRDAVRDTSWELDGATAGTRFLPVRSAACYVPGGRFPLPSSALMTVTAARVAGVPDVIVLSPKIAPETAAAAKVAGADRIFRIGGPQAIAAAAFGTASVPRVDMIVGPGNAYVAEAKRLLNGTIGIDMIAGPSEVLAIADANANPERLAADLLAQAEHDPAAMPMVLTPDEPLIDRLLEQLAAVQARLSLPDYIGESLGRGALVVLPDMDACVAAANQLAPEHLELHVENADELVPHLDAYGCLFIGDNSAEVFGDYMAGTNHVLPTGGSARHSAGLSPLTFLLPRPWLKLTAAAASALSGPTQTLAKAEGLHAHAEAARLRGADA